MKEKKKLSFWRILSNNIFMLNIMRKAAPGFMLASLVTAALQAWAMFVSEIFLLRYAINGINENRSFKEIAVMLVLWLFIWLMIEAAIIFTGHWKNYRFADVFKEVHTLLYKKAAEVEVECYENPKYYDNFVKAIEECQKKTSDVWESVVQMVFQFSLGTANFGFLIFIDPMLLVFAIIPVLMIPFRTKRNELNHTRMMKSKEENRHQKYARRTFYLVDYAKEMRLTGMPVLMLRRFRESGERVIGIIKKYGFTVAVLEYIITECNEMLTVLGATFYACYGAFVRGTIGYGDCLVIINSIDNMAYVLSNSGNMLTKFQENALYIEDYREFLEYESKLKDGEKELPEDGDIVLDHVSFRYDGAEEATLRDISMSFGKKEKIAIVGHNGAGKTTLVKLLLRLYDAQGTITYGGVPIKDFQLAQYRDIFAAVMQDFHIFALTAADNVMLQKRTADDSEIITESLKKSGLYEKVMTFAHKENTIMTKEFDKLGEVLSGGEQQKLAISHVYSKKNRFVILDEPSSALDPIAEYEMYNKMMAACEDCGVIFISHRLSSAVMADRIYLLENGTVAECGTHEELMAANGIYAEMFFKQAENYAEVDDGTQE